MRPYVCILLMHTDFPHCPNLFHIANNKITVVHTTRDPISKKIECGESNFDWL